MTLMNDAPLGTMGSRYRAARQLLGLRQEDIARATGVTRQAVADWEKGVTEPSASKLVLLARATGQPLDWFAEGLGSGLRARRDSNPQPSDWESVTARDIAGRFWTADRQHALIALECQLILDAGFTVAEWVQ